MDGQIEGTSLKASRTSPVPAGSPLVVRVLRSLEEIHTEASDWDTLASVAAAGNPFLAPDWTTAWLETGSHLEPFIITGHEADRLVAVWPLALARGPGTRVLSYVEGDVYGILSEPGKAEIAATTFVRTLLERRDEWDLAILSDHIVGSVDGEAIAVAGQSSGLTVRRIRTSEYPYVDLVKEAKLTDLEKRVGKKIVNEVKRRRRQLEALGPVRVERARSPETVLARFPEIVHLHRQRWRERSDTSGFSSDERIAGMRVAAERFAKRSRLELDLLFVDEQLIAYSYGFVFGGRHVYYSPGFDPAYAPFSVSKILLLQQLADAYGDGLHEFDFSRGAEPYKLVWASGRRAGETVVLNHASAGSRILGAAACALIHARVAAKTSDALVQFKRNTLGKLRMRLSLAYLRERILAGSRTLARSAEDRGRLGTARHMMERGISPIYSRSTMRLYERNLRASPAIDATRGPDGIKFGVLHPSEFPALAAAGRYSVAEIVRYHYQGQRCFVARNEHGAIAAYGWCVAGTATQLLKLGPGLSMGPGDIYIGDCYTHPPFRGRGIYPRLLGYVMATSFQEGRRRAVIKVSNDNTASIRGIEKAGFLPLGRPEVTTWIGGKQIAGGGQLADAPMTGRVRTVALALASRLLRRRTRTGVT
jgi:CelD/BcsL family acetyltransferase involved in cellulose biosynthesis/GNAT superfamily N-acetyltransferase